MKEEMENDLKHISKFMSLVLRHKPDEIGLELDAHGWARVDELIRKMKLKGFEVDQTAIAMVVETNDKRRFSFNDDESLIRANQGHSIEIDLDLPEAIPPDILYHGTATKNVDSILKTGLKKQGRHHVHMSVTVETA